MLSHPAHVLALGFGSGLSPVAPGTCGTLWAWLTFWCLTPWMTDALWGYALAGGLVLGWWACSVTAKNMGVPDPGSIVWDEVLAFWLVLWLLTPASFGAQLAAFVLFRFFDAAKPGPVGWADRLFHGLDFDSVRWPWVQAGWGILLDDLVAAGCTLLVMALWQAL